MSLDSRRWSLCFFFSLLTLLFISTWCREHMCPESVRKSGAARIESRIPYGEMEKALEEAKVRIQYRNGNERFLNGERIITKEKIRTSKTAHHKGRSPHMNLQPNSRKLFQEASKILAQKYKLTLEEAFCGLSELAESQTPNSGGNQDIPCNTSEVYRRADGSCNHPDHPNWGKTRSCYSRLLPPLYGENGKLWKTEKCGERPPPRDISETLFSYPNCSNGDSVNYLHVAFSQLIAHDMILTASGGSGDERCCQSSPEDQIPNCEPILLRRNDSFYSSHNQSCLDFVRSGQCFDNPQGWPAGLNEVTPCIDGSAIYGVNDGIMNSLRRNDGSGKLRSQYTPYGEMLPNCTEGDFDPTCNSCFETGDFRSSQNPPLTAIQTLFLRVHNRVAEVFKTLNPHWEEERLFQEARKVVIALLQLISYNEYLKPVVGEELMNNHDLLITSSRTVCDIETNPTVYQEFVSAAFRYAHFIVKSVIYEDANGYLHLLRDWFFCPESLEQGGLDIIMKEIIKKAATRFDCCMVPDVRNFLYRRGNETGGDLAAIDIQRGRDHGLQSYIKYVELCLSIEIKTFDDLWKNGLMSRENALRLQCMYRVPEAVDLFTAMCLEEPVPGGIVGRTTACLLIKQYIVTKRGDCHWIQDENPYNQAAFTKEQLAAIVEYSFAGIICNNTNITEVPLKPMEIPSNENPMTPCEAIPGFNFEPWRELVEEVGTTSSNN